MERVCEPKKMEEFASLDLILLASGSKVFINSATVRVTNYFLLCFMVTSYIIIVAWNYVRVSELGGFSYLPAISRYSEEMAGVVFLLIMNRNRNKFRTRLTIFIEALDPSQRSSLARHSFWSMVFVLGTVVQEFIGTAFHISLTHRWNDMSHAASDFVRSYNFLNSWFYAGCCIYGFCVKIIIFSEQNYFKDIREKIQSDDHLDLKLAVQRWKMRKQRDKLLNTFSIIPLFWFLHLFIKATVVLIDMIEWYNKMWNDRVWRALPLLHEIITLTYLLYLCDTSTQLTNREIDKLILSLMESGEIMNKTMLVQELKECKDSSAFTVFSTFRINRSFIVALVSSLISFTGLFVDVIYDYFYSLDGPKLSPACVCNESAAGRV